MRWVFASSPAGSAGEGTGVTAAEALRKARATMACEQFAIGRSPDCVLVDGGLPYIDHMDVGEDRHQRHVALASALLDGFSVDEVTEAGG